MHDAQLLSSSRKSVESIHYEIDGNDARYNGKGGWKGGVTSCTHCDLKV